MPPPAQRIAELREQILFHDRKYYEESRPVISDREYDRLMQELIELEKENPDLITPDSPSQRVGGEVQTDLKPVRHAVPMMSIDNTYSEAEVRAFDERVRKALGGEQPEYVLEPKIDGASVSLRYEDNHLMLAATRGRGKDVGEALQQIHEFEKVRPKLPYMTDGMVMKVNGFAHRDKLGAKSKAPRWVIAYKYETEQQPTVLKDVEWQVGRTGQLTPVGKLEPVFIGGVTVSNVTLHNIDQIQRLGIHIGDTIVVERSGEVIPYVVEVHKDKRPAGAKPVQPPKKCPACATPVVREALAEEYAAY